MLCREGGRRMLGGGTATITRREAAPPTRGTVTILFCCHCRFVRWPVGVVMFQRLLVGLLSLGDSCPYWAHVVTSLMLQRMMEQGGG